MKRPRGLWDKYTVTTGLSIFQQHRGGMAMSDKTFAVVFSGKVVEGVSVDRVKGNVAKLFKVEVAKIDRLFSGARVVIKKGLDEATAKKYRMALAKAGALCDVVNAAAKSRSATPAAKRPVAAAQAARAPAARPAARQQNAPESGKSNAGLIKYVVKEAPGGLGEFANVRLDAPGTELVQHQEVAPPKVDVSGLSMDQPGAILGEHEEVAPPQVDISSISMAEPGTDIGKAEEVPELAVDVSGLSMDEPGATLVEHKEVPELQVDTSKLSVS